MISTLCTLCYGATLPEAILLDRLFSWKIGALIPQTNLLPLYKLHCVNLYATVTNCYRLLRYLWQNFFFFQEKNIFIDYQEHSFRCVTFTCALVSSQSVLMGKIHRKLTKIISVRLTRQGNIA